MKRLLVHVVFLFVLFPLIPLFGEEIVRAEGPIQLGFEPYDTVMHPDKSVVYATRLGSKTLYAINYETGAIHTVTLPYPANRVELYQNQLIVTQHKMSHNMYHFGPYTGGIAVVDLDTFTLTETFDMETDPYDIAVDKDGFVYVTNGSGQWVNMKAYSLHDKKEVPNGYVSSLRTRSSILYNEETDKVYTITTDTSPRDVTAFEVKKGEIHAQYDSPYHGDYPLTPHARISPDGLSMYNNSGVVFGLSSIQAGDMHFQYGLGKTYNDYAFSPTEQKMFAASTTGGIDVYSYPTDDYMYSIKPNITAKRLHFQQNGLLTFYSDSGKHYLEHIKNLDFETPERVELESPEIIESVYFDFDDEDFYEFYPNVTDIPIDTFFAFAFDQIIKLANPASIAVTGPNGEVELDIEVDEDILFVEPDYLEEDQLYTLTIGENAVTGLTDHALEEEIKIPFKTQKTPDLTPPGLTLTASTTQPTKGDVTITAKGTDNVGVKSIKLPNGQVITNAQTTFKVSSNGTYTFVVEDVSGLKTTKSIKVANIDKTLPQISLVPSTTSATKKVITITATATDNVKVKRIKLPNGTYINGAKATYSVAANGTYSFTVEDTAGNIVTKSLKVSNIYNKIPASPTVHALWDSHTVIKGKSVPKMTIIVKRGTTQLGTVKTSSTGEFSLTIPKQKAGTKISVFAKDPVNQVSAARVVTVIDKTPPPAPVVNKVTTKAKQVTGTAEKKAVVYVYRGTTYLGKATVDSYGKYKVPIALQKKGVTLEVYAVDPAKNKSKKTFIKVS